LSVGFGHLGYSGGGQPVTSLSINPAFDDFPWRNLSLGVSGLVRYSDSTSSNATLGVKSISFGATGALGFNLWLAERASLWPKL
jgi:hypothetical protein